MIEQIARRNLFFVAIDQVHNLCDRKETYPKREGNLWNLEIMMSKEGNICDDETQVFEKAKKANIQNETEFEDPFSPNPIAAPNALGNQPVHRNRTE